MARIASLEAEPPFHQNKLVALCFEGVFPMARNGKTSKRVAPKPSKIWRSKTGSKIAKSWLDLLLAQAPDHPKSAPKRTARKRR